MPFWSKRSKERSQRNDDEWEAVYEQIAAVSTQNGAKLFGVTSTRTGEGCTTVASRIAEMRASRGIEVLLIDGNVRNPCLHKIFGVSAGQGFTDMVNGEATLSNCVQSTSIENLNIISSGHGTDPYGFYSSERLSAVLDEIRKSADSAIIDLPAVFPFSDVALVAPHVRNFIFVVQAECEPYEEVNKAKTELTLNEGRILGGVLNRSRF